jgi:ATPase subunit of ABC transporter with duplicated ATPase domains
MISVSNLSKSYGDHVLFQGATFQLNPGERYGLVGANGSGKTTLLSILTGDIEATEGTVAMPKRARLGVLRQDQFLHDEATIVNVAMMGNRELYDAMVEKEKLLADTAAGGDFDADRFGELEETVQRLDGYTAEARAGAILEGLGIPAEVHHGPMRTLSGGFKLRVLLAQVLASNPDVLLLDEPTNHLDILSIRWLETFLAEFSGPVVVISHDIRFLDNVATHILDVDYQTVQLYHGNYSDFQVAKHEERERREKDIAGREKEIAELQRFVDRFKAKASKARQAQSKAKVIERRAGEMTQLAPSSRRWPTFRFEPKRDSGKEVLKIEGVKKAYGDKAVLHGVDLTVERGDRLAIMGPNGIGKSTLLKIAMGRLEADAGEVTWGYETHPGYFAQDYKDQFENRGGTAESWIWEACPDKDRGYVRGRMGLVLFSGDDGLKRVDALSGGEAARLVFARIAWTGRTSWCWTSPPTTWTWSPSRRWWRGSSPSTGPSSSSPTTAGSWGSWPRASWRSARRGSATTGGPTRSTWHGAATTTWTRPRWCSRPSARRRRPGPSPGPGRRVGLRRPPVDRRLPAPPRTHPPLPAPPTPARGGATPARPTPACSSGAATNSPAASRRQRPGWPRSTPSSPARATSTRPPPAR